MILKCHVKIMGRYGSPLTVLLCRPKVETLEQFADEINDNQFVIVDHLIEHAHELVEHGPIVINTNCFQKMRQYTPRSDRQLGEDD